MANGDITDAAAKAKAGMEATKTMGSLAGNILHLNPCITTLGMLFAEVFACMYVCLLGRSNYIEEESMRGTPDPGAYAVMAAFETAAKEVK